MTETSPIHRVVIRVAPAGNWYSPFMVIVTVVPSGKVSPGPGGDVEAVIVTLSSDRLSSVPSLTIRLRT